MSLSFAALRNFLLILFILSRRKAYWAERDRIENGGEHAQVDVKMAPIFAGPDGPDAHVKLVVAPIIPTTPAKLAIASSPSIPLQSRRTSLMKLSRSRRFRRQM